MKRGLRLHFAEGQLFDPDTGEVWARDVPEEFGRKLAAWPALADALWNLLTRIGAMDFDGECQEAKAALRAAGRLQ